VAALQRLVNASIAALRNAASISVPPAGSAPGAGSGSGAGSAGSRPTSGSVDQGSTVSSRPGVGSRDSRDNRVPPPPPPISSSTPSGYPVDVGSSGRYGSGSSYGSSNLLNSSAVNGNVVGYSQPGSLSSMSNGSSKPTLSQSYRGPVNTQSASGTGSNTPSTVSYSLDDFYK
jgi:hypothetical protein